MMITTTHPKVLEDAAHGYIDALTRLLDDPEPAVREAAIGLRHTMTAALEHRDRISSDDVRVTVGLINRVPLSHRASLLNQHAPGIGNDGARLVAIGTEQAFDLADARYVTLHNMALTALWLTDSRPDVLAKIADEPSWAAGRDEPFHIFPNGYYQNRPRASETTTFLSMLVGPGATREEGMRLLPALGVRCYMIDLSVHPSRTVRAGKLFLANNEGGVENDQIATPDRRTFLDLTLAHLGNTARVVVYYGSLISSQEPHVARQIARFLGFTRDSPRWNLEDKPRQRLQWAEGNDGRRIVLARALSHDVSNTYMARLREIVQPCLQGDTS
jgi:hypothetical protein